MSTTDRGHIRHQEIIAGDRRSDRRYELQLEVRWKLIRRRRILETGTGETINFSSGGVLFQTDRAMPVGLNIELSIAWPVLLHNVAPLQLVVMGKIVRSTGNRTAVQMTQHEFRTVGMHAERKTPPPVTPPNLFSRRVVMGVR